MTFASEEGTPTRTASGGARESKDRQSVYSRYLEEPAVELGSDGLGTGVELERAEDGAGESDDRITTPFDPERIEILSQSSTVDLLVSRITSGMIDLAPEFQRKAGIWDDGRQSRLIESLLLRIPIPSFYAAEADGSTWAMVDGIQRLTAITRFVAPHAIGARPLRLTGLEYLSRDFHGRTFTDLSGPLQIRLRETQVQVHIIRKGTPEAVMYNIFARINTGGLPLTRQEIRHALISGRARSFLSELAESPEFLDATGRAVSTERMADREMVLRFLAFRAAPPADFRADDFDQFLAQAMRAVNRQPEEQLAQLSAAFRTAMSLARDIFQEYAFRKHWRDRPRKSPINKALFEAVAVSLAELTAEEQDRLRQRRGAVVEEFYDLIEDPDFERAISIGTGDRRNVRLRFDRVGGVFRKVLDRA